MKQTIVFLTYDCISIDFTTAVPSPVFSVYVEERSMVYLRVRVAHQDILHTIHGPLNIFLHVIHESGSPLVVTVHCQW